MANPPTKPPTIPARPQTAAQLKAAYDGLVNQCKNVAAAGVKLKQRLDERTKETVKEHAGDLADLLKRKAQTHAAWQRQAVLEKADAEAEQKRARLTAPPAPAAKLPPPPPQSLKPTAPPAPASPASPAPPTKIPPAEADAPPAAPPASEPQGLL